MLCRWCFPGCAPEELMLKFVRPTPCLFPMCWRMRRSLRACSMAKARLKRFVRSCAGISESDVAKAKDALYGVGLQRRGVSAPGGRDLRRAYHARTPRLPAAEWCFLDPLAELGRAA